MIFKAPILYNWHTSNCRLRYHQYRTLHSDNYENDSRKTVRLPVYSPTTVISFSSIQYVFRLIIQSSLFFWCSFHPRSNGLDCKPPLFLTCKKCMFFATRSLEVKPKVTGNLIDIIKLENIVVRILYYSKSKVLSVASHQELYKKRMHRSENRTALISGPKY